jgi:hypothetical protein
MAPGSIITCLQGIAEIRKRRKQIPDVENIFLYKIVA